jgi:hypothetical protein
MCGIHRWTQNFAPAGIGHMRDKVDRNAQPDLCCFDWRASLFAETRDHYP